MKLEEFYSDPKRTDSGEVPLAREWTSASDPGATFSLFWVLETNEVCALRVGPVAMGPGAPKPYLVSVPHMQTLGRAEQEVTVVGRCARLDEVTAIVARAEVSQRTRERLRENLPKGAERTPPYDQAGLRRERTRRSSAEGRYRRREWHAGATDSG